MKRQTMLYVLAVLVVIAFVAFAGPTIVALVNPTPTPTPGSAVVGGGGAGLANPASVYCTERGYTLEMRDGPNGQTGVCVFPDKSECEEWAFLRGECGVKWQTPTK